MKAFGYPARRLTHFIALGLILVFLLSGCAQRGKVLQNASDAPAVPEAVALNSVVEDKAPDGKDDFFEDEFSSNISPVADPLAPINRVIFKFNDKLYFWALKPIAQGYRVIIPEPVRLGIGNMLYNIAGIGRMANCLLQGKFRSAGGEFGRFFVNSTAGLLGLGNPAANYPALNPEWEDLGQTLGSYGIGNGIYLVLPILGSSTLRDTIGMVGDGFLNPLAYIDPWYVPVGIRMVRLTNQLSFRLGDYEAVKESALDPYILFRSGYIQNRRQMIKR